MIVQPLKSLFVCLSCNFFLLLVAGCSNAPSDRLHGYVEGEFVYVASPLPGRVTLQVARGSQVKKGDPLFTLESVAESAAREEAGRRLEQARSILADLRKGLRPTELEAIRSQLRQARAALELAVAELDRQEQLFRAGMVSAQDHDRAVSARDQQKQLVSRLEADLKSAQLGARADQVTAAEANVKALEAVQTRSEWELSQKSRRADTDALVYDTLYSNGEWVGAGRPVVSLLPPLNIKVRTFVPEKQVSAVQPGTPASVWVDGVAQPFSGKVSYVSPKAEYTPPVIYSRENRAKLMFMVEVVFPPESAARLHPGQPVDLKLGR